MTDALSWLLLAGSLAGVTILVLQVFSLARHLSEAPPRPPALTGISILKPLCGLDDDLERLLDEFARLDYPDYEVLLGVRSTADAAWPVACAAAARHPGRLRVVIQRGEPGFNPKVNQLVTLVAEARHDLFVISDSNVSVDRGYLREVAGHLADPGVGIVTHPVAGVGEERLGALLDNVHMTTCIAPGMVAASRIAGKPIVVGKSIAMRRQDLVALGGFDIVRDVLAEDYVLGTLVTTRLRKRAVIAHRPVFNVTRARTVGEFFARYRRWSVLHRRAVGLSTYAAELLLFPFVLAVAALLLAPGPAGVAAVVLAGVARVITDGACLRMLRPGPLRGTVLLAFPLRELLLWMAWVEGLVRRRVVWRGNRLWVGPGTVLSAGRPRGDALQPFASPRRSVSRSW